MKIKTITVLILAFAYLTIGESLLAEDGFRSIPITENLNAWKLKGPKFMSKWEVGLAMMDQDNPTKLRVTKGKSESLELINKSKGGLDIYTVETFGDCVIEMEVMVAKNGNSGIYVMGQYEVQIKDSHGKRFFLANDDMGGIIDTKQPLVNAAKEPGAWQKITIEFRAPRYKNRKRVSPAIFEKIILNDKVVQKNQRMENGPTGGSLRTGEFEKGPLMLQGGLGAVAYRNIKVRAH